MNRDYFELYKDIHDFTRSELTATTSCLPPCNYYKYSHVGKKEIVDTQEFGKQIIIWKVPLRKTKILGYAIVLANKEIVVEREMVLYDFTSFVSEFGGSLGLFLGFSFFMLWDMITPVFVIFRKIIRK